MRYKFFVVPAAGLALLILGFLAFNSLDDSLIYFRTPTEIVTETPEAERLRLGGQVVAGSVQQFDDRVEFEVGDGTTAIAVVHAGAPAQLFQEGIGVVLEGRYDGTRFFSDTMAVKHDEQYRSDDGGTYKPTSGGDAAP